MIKAAKINKSLMPEFRFCLRISRRGQDSDMSSRRWLSCFSLMRFSSSSSFSISRRRFSNRSLRSSKVRGSYANRLYRLCSVSLNTDGIRGAFMILSPLCYFLCTLSGQISFNDGVQQGFVDKLFCRSVDSEKVGITS